TTATNLRPDASAQVAALGGRYHVASVTALNFFTTLGSRGAQTSLELANQRTKLIAELSKLSAAVIGVSEVQNFADGQSNGATYTNAALSDLTTSLATATGRNYQFIDTLTSANLAGGVVAQNGTDAVRSAILYDAALVTPVGPAALYFQSDAN